MWESQSSGHAGGARGRTALALSWPGPVAVSREPGPQGGGEGFDGDSAWRVTLRFGDMEPRGGVQSRQQQLLHLEKSLRVAGSGGESESGLVCVGAYVSG